MLVPLRDRARDRWASLLPMIGVDSQFLSGRKNGPCLMCGGKTRFRFDDKEGRGTWICNHCGAGDGIDLAMRVLAIDFRELAERLEPLIDDAPVMRQAAERSPEENRASLNRLWAEARPIRLDDPVARYLKARLGLTTFPRCLRTADHLRYQDDIPSYHPAMVAKVSGPDGEAATLHRTYLTHDGRKAAVEIPRRLMPGKVPDGSAIRLFPPSERLGIAEGIETALAASRLFNMPVWAAVSSTMLAKWQPPDCAREIVVFGDADPAFGGQAAAYALAHRLAVRNRIVRVELPPRIGSDWADVVEAELSAKGARRIEMVA